MKQAIKSFWYNLLKKLDNKLNEWLNRRENTGEVMSANNDTAVNFFLMVLKSVLNRVLMDCSFDIVSDSTQADLLRLAVKDIQNNAYKIGG